MSNEIGSKKLTPRGSFLLHMLVGAVIGIGGILPGVSGGVLAVSLGLYEPVIDALAGFFKVPRRNFLFLLPVGLGAVLGFFLGALALSRLMHRWYTQVLWLFLGLVAGGIPSFLKEANAGGFRKRYLLATVLGAALASLMLVLRREGSATGNAESLTPLMALTSGAVVSVGTVLPGVSTAFILMYLGWYRAMMDAFAHFRMPAVLFLAVGAGGCFAATVRAARWLFDRFRGWAYYAMLGFLLVSGILIFPGLAWGWELPVDLALAAGGFAGAYVLGKLDLS